VALRRVLTSQKKKVTRRRDEGAGPRVPLSLRHPRRTLAVFALVIVVLGLLGLNVESRLSPTSLDVGGTQSSKANAMLQRYFGDSAPFPILLRGPAAALDQQGPALIRVLRRDPKVTTISPWDKGSVANLRPSPDKALILADFHVGLKEAVQDTVPYLNDTLDAHIKPPVRATQTGYASISRAIQDESISSAEQDELIALPFLLLVLLLVFRSPVAAMIPLTFGVITVISSRGILTIASGFYSVDAFALTVSSMMGLALGVDYALLMVSRFREELAGGADPATAAQTTRGTAGRTTVFAGSTLFLSMLVSIFIVPGSLLISLATTVIFVVVISVTTATVVAPPLLTLLGPNVDRLRIGKPAGDDSFLMTAVGTALARPKLAAAVIGLVVLMLAGPAIGLKTGPPSQEQLPSGDAARRDAAIVNKAIGAGYSAPFSVVAATSDGTITDSTHLTELTNWQKQVAALPGVRAVIGPDQVARRVKPIQKMGNDVIAGRGLPGLGTVADVRRLGNGLGRAAGGVAQLRVGLAKATFGAVLLGSGSGQAEQGAQTLSSGLNQASAGSAKAVTALGDFATGSRKLAKGQELATTGSLQVEQDARGVKTNFRANGIPSAKRLKNNLHAELDTYLPPLQSAAGVANDQLKTAWEQLQGMTVGKTDPNYPALLSAVQQADAAVSGTDPLTGQPYSAGFTGLPTELSSLHDRLQADADEADNLLDWLNSSVKQLSTMVRHAKKLHTGQQKLSKGSNQLAGGAEQLSTQSQPLNTGLTRLSSGAERLTGGISQLQDGSIELARRLSDGFRQSKPIPDGLRRAQVRVLSSSHSLDKNVRRLRTQSPGLFNSGYFVLSTLDGAPPKQRERAASAIDLRHGGQAANTLVIPKYTFNTPGSTHLYRQLQDLAGNLSNDTGLTTGVAGGPALVNDYDQVTRARIPWVVVAITIATFLMLVLVLRALLLAALAVALNLITVGVAFGVLTLLFNVPEGYPLGGHTYIDAVSATMIFGVVFGLSIDYAVFLLMRMRERHEEGADYTTSISFGLEKTARVITGAALIMMAVFIAFGSAKIATVSQLGIGLTVAVILDATVVRIVLLPALMLMLGERVWWLPAWLDRIMPKIDIHGHEAPEPQAG
jgi:putative drug exporter of the RND superfamily